MTMPNQDEKSATDLAAPLTFKPAARERSSPVTVISENLPRSMQRPNALRQANELKRLLHADMDALMCGTARPIDPAPWPPATRRAF
jgi:hypothetical protein